MDYENGDKHSKKYKSKKYDDESSDDDSDSDKDHRRVKQKHKAKDKYKDKKEHRNHSKNRKDRDFDKSHRDRDIEKGRRDKPHKYRGHRDKEKKHRSKNCTPSPSSKHRRSRSRSYSRSRSGSRSRRRSRSGSRHRSRTRHTPPFKRKSTYDEKRYEFFSSRSGKDLSDSFPHNKGQRKMMILEKLGIDLVIPENLNKPQPGNLPPAQVPEQKGMTVSGELAAYCNITPANSKQIMERLNRKKLLWQNKSAEPKPTAEIADGTSTSTAASSKPTTMWQSAVFSKDSNNKQAEKFKRLMGIKEAGAASASDDSKLNVSASGEKDLLKRQEEMFQNMEMQYEVARASTHTHRGIGLGFGIHQYPR